MRCKCGMYKTSSLVPNRVAVLVVGQCWLPQGLKPQCIQLPCTTNARAAACMHDMLLLLGSLLVTAGVLHMFRVPPGLTVKCSIGCSLSCARPPIGSGGNCSSNKCPQTVLQVASFCAYRTEELSVLPLLLANDSLMNKGYHPICRVVRVVPPPLLPAGACKEQRSHHEAAE